MTEPTTCPACGHDNPHDQEHRCENGCSGLECYWCECTADRRTIAVIEAEIERLKALNARVMRYRVEDEQQRTADAAAMLDAITNGERPLQSFAASSHERPRPLRIGYCTRSPFGAAGPEQVSALQRVLRLLEAQGHHVQDDLDFTPADLDEFLPLWRVLIASAPLLRGKLQPITRWLVDGARRVDRRGLPALHDRLEQLVDHAWGELDVLVTPTVACAPPRIGAFTAPGMDAETGFRAAAVLGGFTAPFNITGQPAISVPAGFTHDELPIGVQLVGRRMQDAQLLALARQLEPELPGRRRPALR